MTESIIVFWTARIAVGCYVICLLGDSFWTTGDRWQSIRRCVWAGGCVVFILHVAAAFHLRHDWSHHAAYVHTARQTADVTGVDWGGGLYLNYLFTVAWVADVLARERLSRGRFAGIFHAFFGFMVLNATVVFGAAGWKWVALAIFLVFAVAWYGRRDHP